MALHPADADVDDASIATRQAELAVTEGSLLADAQWEADAGVRAADRARAVTALDLAQRAEAEAATLRSGLPALRADAEQRRAAALDAAAAGPAAAAEVARLTDLLAKAQQLARLRPELQSRAAALDAAEGAERAAAAPAMRPAQRCVNSIAPSGTNELHCSPPTCGRTSPVRCAARPITPAQRHHRPTTSP